MVFIRKILVSGLLLAFSLPVSAQNPNQTLGGPSAETQKVVVITGARFSYRLVEHWIEAYRKVTPDVQIIVEARGSGDPLNYDILAEVYEHPEAIKETRQYLYIARYAVLPVARTGSAFASHYADKGLNHDTFKAVFFHDIFAQDRKQKPIAQPFTVYTRMQKAGVPTVFANHFGYDQKDIKGTGIAGADSHLLKALLRDSVGVSYLPTPLIYDELTGKPIDGLTVLPADLDGNKKITDNEKVYDHIDDAARALEALKVNDARNIPMGYLHLSVDSKRAGDEAIDFLKWIQEKGLKDLHRFGYLLPDPARLEENSIKAFASRKRAEK